MNALWILASSVADAASHCFCPDPTWLSQSSLYPVLWLLGWSRTSLFCQRGFFCFILMSKSVSLVPYREMLLCFCSFLLYMVMKGERFPWATPHGTQHLSTYPCMSASLFFTSSAEHTLQCILGSCLSFHSCILLMPKIMNYQHVLFPFSQFQMSSQFTASVLTVNP